MSSNLTLQNKAYWQMYKPGEIPSPPKSPPDEIFNNIHGPILDIGTGDGVLAEEMAQRGFEVFGIDIAQNIILENSKRKSKVHYSVQDITTGTSFPSSFFSLIIYRFTLTNIHKDSWKKVGDEVFRILKPSEKIWILEPLVSESYNERYKLASNFVEDKNCVYVFNDKKLANTINTKHDLEEAISDKKVSRIIKHYTVPELKAVFNKFGLQEHRVIKITSPSGFVINTFEGVFAKSSK